LSELSRQPIERTIFTAKGNQMNLTELLDRNVTSPIPYVRECAMAIRGFADASVPDATMHDELRAFGVSEKDIAWEISTGSKLRDVWAQSQYSRAMQVPRRAAEEGRGKICHAETRAAALHVAPTTATAPPAIASRSPAETAERNAQIANCRLARGLEPLAAALVASMCSVDQAIGALRAARLDAKMDPERDMTAETYAGRRAQAAALRGDTPVPMPTLTNGTFDPYAYRRAQREAALANRNAKARPTASTPTDVPALNGSAIFAARKAACRAARNR
jgi:hypothetical protein